MNASLFARVQQVIADLFGVAASDVLPSSSQDTIEKWDSLQHLNLVLALEDEFAVQFTPEEMAELLSAELIVMLLEEKGAA
ncbi:MAG: acyl carrier protein [Myxococcales bacterium]|nr:acyl carrier protein [Myxococcales bacterium]MCB9627128.1 acyl carrier protein [Sandaracinaceae bacterium]